jgi:hypothetical protein
MGWKYSIGIRGISRYLPSYGDGEPMRIGDFFLFACFGSQLDILSQLKNAVHYLVLLQQLEVKPLLVGTGLFSSTHQLCRLQLP